MSTNTCGTKCPECKLWDFSHVETQNSEAVWTAEEYMSNIDSHKSPDNGGHGWGYGYRPNSHFTSKWYVSENCASNSYFEGSKLDRTTDFYPIAPENKYGWIKKQCPLCKTLYSLWMRAEDGTKKIINYEDSRSEKVEITKPTWYCYDLSYYYSFNDEPSEKDLLNKREVTREDLIKAWDDWNE